MNNEAERLPLAQQNLEELGIKTTSLTDHAPVLRIQVAEIDFARAVDMREAIVERMKAIGYRFVALDLDEGQAP